MIPAWLSRLDPLRDDGSPAAGMSIEQRLFRALALMAGLLAVLVVVPMNLLQGLPVFISGCVFLFGVGSLWLFWNTSRGRYSMKLLFFFHMANLDLIWFSNAGSHGSIGMFFMTAGLYLVIFFRGRTRWWMLGCYLANGIAILWLEWRFPAWLWPFPDTTSRYLDLTVGFVLSSLVCILILWVVLAAYHRERHRLAESLEALSAGEARFKALVMNAPVPICVTNPKGVVAYVNRSFEQLFGYTIQDIPDLQAWWLKAYPDPDQRDRVSNQWLKDCGAALAAREPIPPAEYAVTRQDGSTAFLDIQAAFIGDQWLVMFSDVTERRRSEESLRQTQKLESLGVLAGGIAHDFNNLLSAMLGNLNLAQMKLTPGAASGPYLDHLEGAINKAVALTRQMLAYSGRGRFVVQPLSLNDLVTEITHLLAVSISKKVRLVYDLAPGLPAVEADSAQLQQVIMNLITNASEAIGDQEGVITLTTRPREVGAGEVGHVIAGQTLDAGRYVTLEVADTGCGIDPSFMARIFDPFFSTKGSGRGLGLSAMLGILRGHQGGIDLHTTPGKGSAFRIFLPASEAKVQEARPADVASQGSRFHGKVLLVDDEADLRFSFGSMLQHLGFQVVAARDGFEALERFVPREFTLVFMDLTMPRMDGKEAFFQMKARDPEVKVILASGYSEREAFEPVQGLNPAGFIQKPFNLAALTQLLERVLG